MDQETKNEKIEQLYFESWQEIFVVEYVTCTIRLFRLVEGLLEVTDLFHIILCVFRLEFF